MVADLLVLDGPACNYCQVSVVLKGENNGNTFNRLVCVTVAAGALAIAGPGIANADDSELIGMTLSKAKGAIAYKNLETIVRHSCG